MRRRMIILVSLVLVFVMGLGIPCNALELQSDKDSSSNLKTIGVLESETVEDDVYITINDFTYETPLPEEPTIKYAAGCPSSPDGKHHMEGRGKCIAKVKSTGKKYKGQGGQCKYCYLLTVTQNNLFLNPSIPMGWYATRQATFTQGGPFTMEVKKIYKNKSTSEQIWKTFKWE